jgi:hypothetical protein
VCCLPSYSDREHFMKELLPFLFAFCDALAYHHTNAQGLPISLSKSFVRIGLSPSQPW